MAVTPFAQSYSALGMAFVSMKPSPRIAQEKVDIIIGCSLQRSDSHDAVETMCRFLAYNTNAYVLRSSVSFDEDSTICGASMVVFPEGKVLANMGGKFGMTSVEFDPQQKYLKPAGFGNPDAAHHECIEIGRSPWQYHNAVASVVLPDSKMSCPVSVPTEVLIPSSRRTAYLPLV